MRSISVRSATFQVHDSHKRYWDQANSGQWETETFDVIDSHADAATTVVDIGAWIGPITLYSGRVARRVIAIEPDPVAFRQLEANLSLNPDLTNISVINAAVATRSGNIRLGVRDQPGDSTSSVLVGGSSEGWDVKAVTLDEILSHVPSTEKVFFKIDIEGYEFELIDEIVRVAVSRNAPVYLSLHPHYFEVAAAASVQGKHRFAKMRRSILKRTTGRAHALAATRKLVRSLRGRVAVLDEYGRKLSLSARPARVLAGRNVTRTGAVLLMPSGAASSSAGDARGTDPDSRESRPRVAL
jgi:FkbM family methyltransferase